MLAKYYRILPKNESVYLENVTHYDDLKPIHLIAIKCIYYDLVSEFAKVNKSDIRTIEEEADTSYWSSFDMYSKDSILRVCINNKTYLFHSISITKNDTIIVKLYDIGDMVWYEEEDILELLQENEQEPVLFEVEY